MAAVGAASNNPSAPGFSTRNTVAAVVGDALASCDAACALFADSRFAVAFGAFRQTAPARTAS